MQLENSILKVIPVKVTPYRIKPDKQHNECILMYQQLIRLAALSELGDKCACCGETTYEFLSFDHIKNGKGNPCNKSDKGVNLHISILKGRRENIQILCHNCNCSKGYYGCCPHALKST